MTISDTNSVNPYLLGRLRALLPAMTLPDPERAPSRFEAAVLDVEINGALQLAEKLARSGRDGASFLSQALDNYVSALVQAIEVENGQVARIEGDKLRAFFPRYDNETAAVCREKAERAALKISQTQDTNFTSIPTISYGLTGWLTLGSAGMGREIALAEPAEDFAGSAAIPAAQANHTATASFDGLEMARLAEWTPPAVWQRLRHDPKFKGEWGRAIAVCIEFKGPDPFTEEGMRHIQQYYGLVENICSGQSGWFYSFQPGNGDKPHQINLIFGALLSQIDDAERALRAALLLRRLPDYVGFVQNQAIGIASSNVFMGVVGSENRQQFVVIGEALPNAAKAVREAGTNPRLRSEGGLLVDHYTSERVALNFLFGEVQAIEQPAKKFPMKMSTLLTERAFVSSLERAWKERSNFNLVGRWPEREQLEALAAEALGGMTRAFLLVGEEGSGKAALMSEVSRQWLARSGSGAVGINYQYSGERPYLGWAGVLAWLCDFTDNDTRMSRVAKINAAVTRYAPGTPELVAPMQQLLNVTPFDRVLFKNLAEATTQRDSFFEFVQNLITGKSEAQPLMLTLRDLQWSDASGLALLQYLIKELKAAVLFGLSSRQAIPELAGSVLEIAITPLSSYECADLAQQLSQGGLVPDQINDLTKMTAGNPLQIVQAVQYWKHYQKLPENIEELTLFSVTSQWEK